MTDRRSFDDMLDSALEAMRGGQSIDGVLSASPEYAEVLRPLLETASTLNPSGVYLPPTARLQANFAVVQGALASTPAPQAASDGPEPWWGRRWKFATLSIPVGVLAFAALGAGGAAAATVAATTDLPEQVAETVHRVTPAWSHAIIPGDDGESGEHLAAGTPDDSSTPTPPATPAAGGEEATAEADHGPQPVA